LIELAAVPSTGRASNVEPRSAAEADAVARLYDRHSRRIFGFCLHQLRKRDEAEDAVQMTFMYALGALRRGVVPAAESAWLLKIARNVCLSRFDAVRRRSNVEQPRDPLVLAETAPAMPDDGDVPNLREALARLPERQCRAIVMREWQGLSYAEIATELGIGTSAVETLIFRARQSLARELRGEEQDEKRRTLDLRSLLSWAKSLLGGGAAKIAVGAAVVATVGAAASVPLVHSSTGARHPSPAGTPAVAVHAAPAAARPAPKPVRLHASRRGQATPTVHAKAPAAAPLETPSAAPPPETPAAEPVKGAAGGPAQAPAATVQSAPAGSAPAVPTAPAAPAAPPAPAAPAAPAPAAPAPSLPTAPVDVPSLPPVQVPAVPPVPTPSLPAPPSVQAPTVPPVPGVPEPPTLPTLP
jgi:RNA polymerase sigma factor (sigma-70 family)